MTNDVGAPVHASGVEKQAAAVRRDNWRMRISSCDCETHILCIVQGWGVRELELLSLENKWAMSISVVAVATDSTIKTASRTATVCGMRSANWK